MSLLSEIDLHDVLFLDIETVPQYPDYEKVPEPIKKLWEKKAGQISRDESIPEEMYHRAAVYAEFGKIICISVGVLTGSKDEPGLRIKSYAGEDEKKILEDFGSMLHAYSTDRNIYLCAHNGKEFDFPYLGRRMLINGIALPGVLDLSGRKPWEIKHLDTMELWKFGDYKHYTSLELLTTIFDIPSPKDDIDGSMVGKVFWEDKDLSRIVAYCQNDVLAVTQLLLRYTLSKGITPEKVEIVS